MAWQHSVPRKRRTRQHVIAALSVNYVERFVISEGHTSQHVEYDYGYDLAVTTYDPQGYAEPGTVYVQVKAADTLSRLGEDPVFQLEVRDYHLWLLEIMPVVLVLFDASRRKAYWLSVQDYFREDPSRRPRKGVKTVRIRIPSHQTVTRRAVERMRALKQAVFDRLGGSFGHA